MFHHLLRPVLTGACLALLLTAGTADAKAPLAKSTYTRPSATAPTKPAPLQAAPPPAAPASPSRPVSAGDLAQSRAAAGTSLRAYRTDQEYRAQFRQPAGSVPASGRFAQVPHESYDSWNDRRSSYYGGTGWAPPAYMYHSRPSFGMWDAMWMWFMLDSLSNASHAAFFYNHNNDPGYHEWRQEADRLAVENADLKEKLAALDGDMASRTGQTPDPNYLPGDVAPQVALAAGTIVAEPARSHFPWAIVVVVAIVGGGGYLAVRAWQRQPAAALATAGGTMNLGTYVHNRLSGKGYAPTPFRVGMTIACDESPFILAAGHIAATPPLGRGGHLAARAIGTLGSGDTAFHRVYVDGGFFQLHLDAQGEPDECRWFSQLDEFTPAGQGDPNDGNSWAFWLDDGVGQIGWPAFETPGGKRYERAWTPGSTRVPPVGIVEQLDDGHAARSRQHSLMLYWRATGLQAPSPDYEYALLDVVEDGTAASVIIHAGIDINPASLALSA